MADEKSCGVIIFTNEGNVRKYVIIRGVGIYQGYYGFPGGHVEPGETEQETAIREVKEETGLDVVLFDDFRTVDEHPLAREGRPNDRKTNVYFLAEYHGQGFVMQKSEVSEITLLTYDEAMKCMQYEGSRRELTEAEEYLRKYSEAVETDLCEEFRRVMLQAVLDGEKDWKDLHGLLVKYKDKGMNQQDMYDNLDELRKQVQTEEQEDLVRDLMDFVVGYCRDKWKVFG